VIVVCGEALIDLTSSRTEPGRFDAHPGGGPCNTAVGLVRQGVATGFLGRLSLDEFGVKLRSHLSGVDLSRVVLTMDPSTLAIAHIAADGGASYAFYAQGTADPGLTASELPDLGSEVTAIHMGTCALVFEPCGSTLEELFLRERSTGTRFLALDPNVRMGLVRDVAGYRARLERMIAAADLIKVSDADIEALWPGESVEVRVASLASTGPALIVLTRGGDDLTAFRADGSTVTVPAQRVEVVDTIGAGDTANAAMLSWLERRGQLTRGAVVALSADDVHDMLTFAARAAAITCSRAGANPPTLDELL
jgi:fructokinase